MKPFVFIDLDGTLTDSAPGLTAAIAHALEKMGLSRPEEAVLRGCIGPSLLESFPRLGVAVTDMDRALEFFVQGYETEGLFRATPYPGAHEMLQGLKDQGFGLALATAKPLVEAKRITAHFGFAKFMDAEFGAMDTGGLIDKHALIADAAVETGADIARSFMIGDRRHDVAGALASGVTPVGALWGYGEPGELEKAGAKLLAKSPLEAAALITGERT